MKDRIWSLDGERWKGELLLILAVSVPLLFWAIGSLSFRDPDEGMYGTIAREMAEGGDWITPHFNGVRYFEKPPLYFWLTAFTTAVFGPSEWAVRVWSSISALGTVLLVWRIGAWLYGQYAGFLAAVILATSVGIYHYSHVAFTDLLFLFFLTLSIYGFIDGLLHGRGRRSDFLLFYLGTALAVLSKGLIGLVFPVLIIGLFILCRRHHVKLHSMNLKWGLCLFLVLVLPWHLLAAWNNPGFLWFYFFDNHFLRFLHARGFFEDDVQLRILSFLIVFFIWFFPWSLSLPVSLGKGFPRFRPGSSVNESLRLLMGLWALIVLGFFSLSFAKLEHYSLAALPAVSLMVGGRWAEAFSSSKSDLGLKWCLGVTALASSLFGGWLLRISELLTTQDVFTFLAGMQGYYRTLQAQGWEFPYSVTAFIPLAKWVGFILVFGPAVAFILFSVGKVRASFTMFLGVAVGIAFSVFSLHFLTESDRSSSSVARAVLAHSSPGDPIIHEGLLAYSAGLRFYTGRKIYVLNGRGGDLEFGSRYPEARHLFLENGKFIRMWEGDQQVFLVTRSEIQQSVVKNLSSEKVFLVGRYGSRRLYTNQQMANSK